jgi:hypothetical protein
MQYTFSMTSRMVTLVAVCLILLCVLLFLVGFEIGQEMAGKAISVQTPDISKALPAPPKLPGAAEVLAPLVPTTKP